MPKISELNDAAELGGTEMAVLVQNGDTVKVALAALLNAPRTPTLGRARWIKSSDSAGIIDAEELSTDSRQWANGFAALALVDCVKSDNDVLLWEYGFSAIPELKDKSAYVAELSDGGQQSLSEGRYSINLASAGTASYTLNGDFVGSFSELGEAQQIIVPIGVVAVMAVTATGGAVVRIFTTGYFDPGGDTYPTVFAAGNQLTLAYAPNTAPVFGSFAATARLYRDGAVLADSNAVSFAVTTAPEAQQSA